MKKYNTTDVIACVYLNQNSKSLKIQRDLSAFCEQSVSDY